MYSLPQLIWVRRVGFLTSSFKSLFIPGCFGYSLQHLKRHVCWQVVWGSYLTFEEVWISLCLVAGRNLTDWLTDCWRSGNCESRCILASELLCTFPNENGSSPTSSVPTLSVYCTLCSNLKGKIPREVIILMLQGLILDLPQSHFLALRCSCWYIVMQI